MNKRIVVKVGTSTLTHQTGRLNLRLMDSLCRVLADLRHAGREIILVSSGATGVGAAKLGLSERPRETMYKQAAAAVGQCELMHIYDKFFGEYGLNVAQLLFSKADLFDRKTHSLNAINALLEYGALPVVNENDSVAVEELEFGDNDTLSAEVAALCSADLLVILSDIDGFYDRPPSAGGGELIRRITKIDENTYNMAGGTGTQRGTGGMVTKLRAAEIAMGAGIPMILTGGGAPENLYAIAEGKTDVNYTLFEKGDKS